MKERITERDIREFCAHLQENEKSGGTVQKYLRDLLAFRRYVGADAVTKENVKKWKEFLLDRGYAVSTVNSMLTAVNRFLRFSGMEACCVRRLRHQKMIFSDEKRELTRKEYFRLLNTAEKQGKRRLSLVMQTICSTGIRVSELKYITVQSLKSGKDQGDFSSGETPAETERILPETGRSERSRVRNERRAGTRPIKHLERDEETV